MRKFILLLSGFILLIFIGLAALTLLVPAEKYKQEILTLLEQKTGRKVTIAGPMKFNLFPDMALSASQVTVSNPAWAGGGAMIEVGELRVRLKLLALLHKEIALSSLKLVKPNILLVQKGAQKNWELETQNQTAATTQAASKQPAYHLNLGTISIEQGQITFRDLTQPKAMVLSEVNINLAAGDLQGPLTLKGSAVYEKQNHAIEFHVDRLADMQQATSPFTGSWNAGNMSAAGKGTLSMKHGLEVAATITSDITGLHAMLNREGMLLPDQVHLKGNLHLTKPADIATIDLTDAEIGLDKNHYKGRIGGRFGEAVPYLAVNLQTDSLDFGNSGATAAPAGNGKATEPHPTSEAWSDQRIDFSGLGKVNADITLNIGTLHFKQAAVTPANITATLRGGALSATLKQAGVYSGKVDLAVKASTAGALALDLSANGIQAEPLLKDWAEYDRLQGTLNGTLHISSNGDTQRLIVSHLNGNGAMRMQNGVYKSRNILNIARGITSAIQAQSNSSDATTFSDLSASFVIANGIVSNHDLVMHSSLLGLSGEGTVDLPAQRVNYLVKPLLLTTSSGKGATADKGIAVPIRITGPMLHPDWIPDLAAAAKQLLADPAQLKSAVKNFKTNLKSGDLGNSLKGLLGGFKQKPAAQ